MAAHLLDPLDKTTIKTTKLSSGCDWIEADGWRKAMKPRFKRLFEQNI